MKKITKTVYIDGTDFLYEIGEAAGGNKVYASLNDIHKHQSCSKDCGVVRATITLEEWVHPSHLKGMTVREIEKYKQTREYKEHLKQQLESAQKVVGFYEKLIEEVGK